MPTHRRYVIGLGSNMGDRLTQLERGLRRLAELGRLGARSAVYESDAWGGPEQGPFLNAAVALDADLDPRQLLGGLLEIERTLGRERRERWGPRTLDLDILWGRGLWLVEPGLSVPHERLAERTFALRPLLDVEPGADAPPGQEAYAVALGRLTSPALRRLREPPDWAKDVEIPEPPPHHALR
ncbi:MAG: 2-amino-4-hydroxy-6-hydroxymethyldihydropteridine diphosphokinase [Myxococcales bacterium]|nr:2-amino-4-hydroxy-6-hydroxymethyldihydropteridine diphosphokinase [Myxococcales bacterium]